MRFLVTGATGKVGNAVDPAPDRARRRGRGARPRSRSRPRVAAGDEVELARGDVTDPDSIARRRDRDRRRLQLHGDLRAVAARPRPRSTASTPRARATWSPRRATRAPARVVHTSTFDVFEAERGGTVSEAVVATSRRAPHYERSKQRAERAGARRGRGRRDRGRDLQPRRRDRPRARGPTAGLDAALRDALRRRLPAVPPGGMTLVYVDDVAAGHLAAFDRGRPGERYILADGYATMREIVAAAVEAGGRGRVPPQMPEWLAQGDRRRRRGGLAGDPAPAADRQGRAHLPALGGARRQHEGPRGARGRVHAVARGGRAHGPVDDRERPRLRWRSRRWRSAPGRSRTASPRSSASAGRSRRATATSTPRSATATRRASAGRSPRAGFPATRCS